MAKAKSKKAKPSSKKSPKKTKRVKAKPSKAKASKPAPKATRKVAPKKKASPKKTSAANPVNEKRQFTRHPVENLWVTEFDNDYQFLLEAADISEGGIFLKQRMKTDSSSSLLRLNLGKLGTVRVQALPVHDRMTDNSYGTGYRFTALSPEQAKALRSFLRDLN